MAKKVCIAFDGSETSYRAFDFALELCQACPGTFELAVLSVAVAPDIVEVDWEVVTEATKYHFGKLHDELKEKAEQKGMALTTTISVGHAAEQIVSYAAENHYDLVIVGQKGKSAIKGFFLGSVSRRVATHCPCTVIIVK